MPDERETFGSLEVIAQPGIVVLSLPGVDSFKLSVTAWEAKQLIQIIKRARRMSGKRLSDEISELQKGTE